MDRSELISILARYVASRKLDSSYVLPAIEALAETEGPVVSISELLETLEPVEDREGEAISELVGHLKTMRRSKALECHRIRQSEESVPEELRISLSDLPLDAPQGWTLHEDILATIQSALRALADRLFVSPRREVASVGQDRSSLGIQFHVAVAGGRPHEHLGSAGALGNREEYGGKPGPFALHRAPHGS